MISIFNGRNRGLESGDKQAVFVQFSVELRNHLSEFKGAKWAVFCAVALHADENGWAWPSIDTLARETGYNSQTVSRAISSLCDVSIEGRRVLLSYQPREQGRGGYKSNRYLIFPTADEIARYGGNKEGDFPSISFPYTEDPNTENLCTKKNQSKEETLIGADAPAVVADAKPKASKPVAVRVSDMPEVQMVARICKANLELMAQTDKKRLQVYQVGKKFAELGYTADDIYRIGVYWYQNDKRAGLDKPMRERAAPWPTTLLQITDQALGVAAVAEDRAWLEERKAETARTVAKIEAEIKPSAGWSEEDQRAAFASFYTMS